MHKLLFAGSAIWLVLLCGIASAAEEVADDTCILELMLPDGATVTVDGHDYGVERRLEYTEIAPEQDYTANVHVRFADGSTENSTVLIRAGQTVPLALAGPRSSRPELVLQTGLAHGLQCAALSSDGRYLLTGSGDTPTLLDATTGRTLQVFQGHKERIRCVAFSPDGRQVLTGAWDKTAILWDVLTGDRLRTFTGHRYGVVAVAFSPDGQQVATTSYRTPFLWNARTGAKLRTLSGHSENVTSMVFSSDGRQLLTGSEDKTAILWNTATGQRIRVFQGHEKYVRAVAFSPDGKQVLTGGGDYKSAEMYTWDAATGKMLMSLAGHTKEVISIAFSADGLLAATCSSEEAIVWDVGTGEQAHVLPGSIGLNMVTFCPESRSTLLVVGFGEATWWNVATGDRIREHELTRRSSDGVESVAFSADGLRAIVVAAHQVVVWDVPSGEVLHRFRRLLRGTSAIDSQGRRLVALDDGNLVLWDLVTGETIRTLDKNLSKVSALALSSDGQHVLTASHDKTGALWDANTGEKVRTFTFSEVTNSLKLSPDGGSILTKNGTLVELATGNTLAKFPTGWVWEAIFSPDGRYVLTGTEGNNAKAAALRSISTGAAIHTFPVSPTAYSMAFSRDGSRLALGSRGTAAVWDAGNGARLRTFETHGGRVNAVAFSPNGQQLLTGTTDGVAQLWDIATGREVAWMLSLDPSGIGWEHEWAVATPEGLFDGSAAARQQVTFRLGGGLTVVPVDRFFQDLYRPGLLAEVLSGKRPLPGIDIGSSIPPQVRIVSQVPKDAATSQRLQLEIEVTDQGGGMQDPWLVHNGARVNMLGQLARQDKTIRQTFDISLDGGENKLEFFSASEDGAWESEPAIANVRCDKPLSKPDLYVVGVGINRYAEGSMQLKYATSDAHAVAELFRSRGPALYSQVHATTLVDEDATKSAILQCIQSVAQKARPQDTLVVFLAGHGTMIGENYYFLPADFRRQAASLGQDVESQGLLANDLGVAVTAVPALRRMLIFDTGQSGGPLAPLRTARRPFSFRGAIERLARTHGMFTIAAGAATPDAKEMPALEHGALTYTLLAGLQAVAGGPLQDQWIRTHSQDRVPHVLEWYGFASSHVPRLSGWAQNVQHNSAGASFPVLPALASNHVPRPVAPLVAPKTDMVRSPEVQEATSNPAEPSSGQHDLYVVAVGISQYAESQLSLQYAHDDARAIVQLCRSRGADMYGHVHGVEILDAKATKDGILRTVESTIQQAKPEDTLLLFLAGHGKMVGQRYYFITHEFRHDSDSLEEDLRQQGLAADVLADTLGQVGAQKRILVLDTCASGGALGVARGQDEVGLRGAIDRLGRERGVFTIAASAAGEEAQEIEQLKHGVLTYALLAGLDAVPFGPLQNQGIEPLDPEGVADVLEWFSFATTHVPQLTERYLGQRQEIETSGHGTAFLLLPSNGPQLPSGGPPPAVGESLAATTCVLKLNLPEGTVITVNDQEYGPQEKLRFQHLEPGEVYVSDLHVRFPDGSEEDHSVDIEGGRTVRFRLSGPRATRRELLLPPADFATVNSVAFGRNGQWVLTGGSSAILWDAATGTPLREFPAISGLGYGRSADLSPDGRMVAGVCSDRSTNRLILLETLTGRKLHTLDFESAVHCVAFSPDGKRLLCGTQEKKAFLCNTETGSVLHTLWGHSMAVEDLAFSPDGRLVATASRNGGMAIVWEVATGKRLQTIRGSGATAVAISPDGSQVAVANRSYQRVAGSSSSSLCSVNIHDISSGQKLLMLQGHKTPVTSIAFSPDGAHLLSGGGDPLLRTAEMFLWDATTGEKLRSYPGHEACVQDVTFSPNAESMLTGSLDGTAILRNAATGQQIRTFRGRADRPGACVFAPNGRKLVAVGGSFGAKKGQIAHWNLDDGTIGATFSEVNQPMQVLDVSPNGTPVAAAGMSIGTKDQVYVKLWDATTGRWLQKLEPSFHGIRSLTFSPNGHYLLAVGSSFQQRGGHPDLVGRVVVWDIAAGELLHDIIDQTGWGNSATFSPDGRHFLTACSDWSKRTSDLVLWNTVSGRKLQAYSEPLYGFWRVSFSPNGELVLAAGSESQFRPAVGLWNAETGKKLREIPQEGSFSATALFSPDGRYVVSSSMANTPDQRLTVWDTATAKRLRSFDAPGVPQAFSPDGRWLVGQSQTGRLSLWDFATGKLLVQLLTLDQGKQWLAVTPDGFFDGSPEGRQALSFRIGDGLDVVPVERFHDEFYRPGLLKQVFEAPREAGEL